MALRPFLRSLRPGQVRSDHEADIRQEIELYLELRTEELVEEGLDREEARRVAEERFGDSARIEAELRREATRRRFRQGRQLTMGGLRQDFAFALRTFRRSPGFALVAVVTLGLALGGNTAIYSVVEAALVRALPFEDAERLVFVNGYHLTDGQIAVRGASYPEFRDWNARSQSISPMAATDGYTLTLTGQGSAERIAAELVTEEYFRVLDVQAARGRLFQPVEHSVPDAHPVVVISDGLWKRSFGEDPSVLGRTILLNDRPLTVVGILPEGFGGTRLDAEAWIPESILSLVGAADNLETRGNRSLTVVGRLSQGTGTEQAQHELDLIARELQAEHPADHEDRFAQVRSFRESYLGDTGQLLWVLFGAGGVLLLIGAANVANLLLVRSHGRTREIVLRRALGAQGSRVAGQLVTESLVLAAAGGMLGLALAWIGLELLTPLIPQGVLPGFVQPALSTGVFLFSSAVLLLVGLATGLVPAVASARLQLAGSLRQSGRASAGDGPWALRAQHAFVIVQVALALALMVGAGLLTRSFRAQLAVDPGSDIERVQAFRLQLPIERFDNGSAVLTFAQELERRVASLPGVESAALSSDLPFRGGSSGAYVRTAEAPEPESRIRVHVHIVSPTYFETLGVGIVEGRGVTAQDAPGSARVAVVTETFVRRVFPDGRAVGRTVHLGGGSGTDNPIEIVGVVEDVRYRDLTTSLEAEANSPDIFFPYAHIPVRSLEVSARAQGDPADLAPTMRATVAELDPDLPVFAMASLASLYRNQTAAARFAAFLMGLFSALALVLACVGIFGVLAFTVGQRRREIAVRRAIGASAGGVAAAVVGDGLKLVVLGPAIGALAAESATGVLDRFLYGVAPNDLTTFLTVAGAMVAVSVLASGLPAVRAAKGDPAEALSAE